MDNSSNKSYDNGKIYIIRNYVDNDTYIGSSCQALCKRFQNHKDSLNSYKRGRALYKKMNELGKEQFYIELIEQYPCENVEQLRRREGEIIRELKPVLNKQVAGRTINEWREDNKEYIQEDKRQYHLENQENFNKKFKKWYEDNTEKAKAYRSVVINCPCGVSFTRGHKARHLKSKHHQNFILNNNINNVFPQTEEETNSQACSSTSVPSQSQSFYDV